MLVVLTLLGSDDDYYCINRNILRRFQAFTPCPTHTLLADIMNVLDVHTWLILVMSL